MKHKTPLVLMEMLIMVLVFALASAICLRMFAASEQLSQKNEAVSYAVLMVQNAAEELKASCGDQDMAGEQTFSKDDWTYRLEIGMEESGVDGLGSAQVRVYGHKGRKKEELLFEIPVAWQEGLKDE